MRVRNQGEREARGSPPGSWTSEADQIGCGRGGEVGPASLGAEVPERYLRCTPQLSLRYRHLTSQQLADTRDVSTLIRRKHRSICSIPTGYLISDIYRNCSRISPPAIPSGCYPHQGLPLQAMRASLVPCCIQKF
ncbi:hypothetical protein VTN00DRAFT_3743 [Thermoascus crustaceus]|uniref:uncharacterized protein n=1 Tax=Thermoascus crustaceus TaxID=5088 RepID=UPI003742B42E